MLSFRSLIILTACLSIVSCGSKAEPLTPRKTFEMYTKAVQQKDVTTMKLLLSAETLKMHQQEARAQNISVDEIVKRETFLSEGQKTVYLRNEKIDGQTATLEVKNSSGNWETVPFVFEDNQWKIDKKGYADRLSREIEEEIRKAEEAINNSRIEISASPTPQPDENSNTDGISNSNGSIPD